ncbi:AAA family ATPase [Rathayibacter sp. VKM Ac-2754]|nr:AAA family ATPase [Rathayibacter sp. VKM Ac-2754]
MMPMPLPLAPTALVGRDDDLAALRRAYERMLVDGTRTVVVGGEAGIGKSRLVAEFVQRLPREALVLRGQCVDLDRDAPPYAPITAPLRELARSLGADELAALAGPSIEGLRILLPELPSSGEPAAAAPPVLEAVTVALEAASRLRPIVLVVEDLHWVDPATIGVLRFLVRVATAGRILVVLTFRSDQLRRGDPLRAWLPELERSDRVQRRELSRLDRHDVEAMVASLRGAAVAPRDLALVVERTEGVPFFVEEFARAEASTVPDCYPESLRDVLLARYDGLSEPTQKILRTLSAGGTCVEHDLITVVHGDAEAVETAAREAIAGGVLVVDGSSYSFRHALVRDAIHDELLPGERVRAHTCYADALEARGPAAASEISYHWMAAHDSERAFAASLRAMAHARASFAHALAARMGERALELWEQVPADAHGRDRADLLGSTAHHFRDAGESERAIALVDEALAIEGLDAPRRATLLRDKASYLANLGQVGSVALLREALALLGGPAEPSVLRARILGELAARLMLEADLDEAVAVADLAEVEAESVGSHGRRSVAVNIRGTALVELGRVDEGLAQLELAGALAGDDDSARLRYWLNLSDALSLVGRFREAVAAAEEGAEHARRHGVSRTLGAMLMANAADALASVGEWRRAEELLDRALELDAPLGFAAHLQRRKLWTVLWRGDPQEAATLLARWRQPLSRQLRTERHSLVGLAKVAGAIALETGDVGAAWAEVRDAIGPEHRPLPSADLLLLVVVARIVATARREGLALLDREGRPVDAEARVRAILATASAWPTAPAFVAVIEAELGGASRTGDDPAAWAAAAAANEVPTALVHLLPYSRLRLAEALAAVGRREEAEREARAACAVAENAGLGLLIDAVSRFERRLGRGEVPGAIAPHGISPLTDRERQVLALVAQGLGNRAIADELFISVKTASVHVSNILRKLGAATRTEAAYLARESAGS